MNKQLVGIVAGALLGIVDGATAWFTPAARSAIVGILVGSPVKGMLVGLASGYFARKVKSIPWGIAFGAVLGLILAWAVASMPQPDGEHYYLQIMTPGCLVCAIIGFLTQTQGITPLKSNAKL